LRDEFELGADAGNWDDEGDGKETGDGHDCKDGSDDKLIVERRRRPAKRQTLHVSFMIFSFSSKPAGAFRGGDKHHHTSYRPLSGRL